MTTGELYILSLPITTKYPKVYCPQRSTQSYRGEDVDEVHTRLFDDQPVASHIWGDSITITGLLERVDLDPTGA
jgi:hypothetical protein